MMTIRRQQISELASLQEMLFVQKIINIINNKFTEGCKGLGVSLKEQEMAVLKGLKEAKSYGIGFEADLIFYIECLILLGLDFDKKGKSPNWPNKILSDSSLSGESKTNLIHENIMLSNIK